MGDCEYRCKLCKKTYEKYKSFQRHLADKHKPNRKIRCDSCGFVCYRNHDLKRHQVTCRARKQQGLPPPAGPIRGFGNYKIPKKCTLATETVSIGPAATVTSLTPAVSAPVPVMTNPTSEPEPAATKEGEDAQATVITPTEFPAAALPSGASDQALQPALETVDMDELTSLLDQVDPPATSGEQQQPVPPLAITFQNTGSDETEPQHYQRTVRPSADDPDFFTTAGDGDRTTPMGVTCQQTLRLARLLGDERYRRVDFNKFRNGTVTTKIFEKCVFPDGTVVSHCEERVYHPPASEYFSSLGF